MRFQSATSKNCPAWCYNWSIAWLPVQTICSFTSLLWWCFGPALVYQFSSFPSHCFSLLFVSCFLHCVFFLYLALQISFSLYLHPWSNIFHFNPISTVSRQFSPSLDQFPYPALCLFLSLRLPVQLLLSLSLCDRVSCFYFQRLVSHVKLLPFLH